MRVCQLNRHLRNIIYEQQFVFTRVKHVTMRAILLAQLFIFYQCLQTTNKLLRNKWLPSFGPNQYPWGELSYNQASLFMRVYT